MDGAENRGFAWWCNRDDALVVEVGVVFIRWGLENVVIEEVEFTAILLIYLLELKD